jgi:cytochrome d ubiquinol oxidase subunit I
MDVNQHYLYEARQMQALSLAVHIPLVCFGIAFPVLVLFAEWRYLRTGDQLYRTLARRWSRIMLALFAVGVVTGTILSFELGLLWPVWMQDFGNVFGLGFTLEGFSFFVEAIFIGIYAYGWDRLSPRLHFASGFPIAIAGVAGSLFVIAVNGWMNHPTGFTLVDGRAADVQPWSALFANPEFWSEYVHTCTSRPTSCAGSCSPGPTRGPFCAGGAGGTSGQRWGSRCPPPRSRRRCR